MLHLYFDLVYPRDIFPRSTLFFSRSSSGTGPIHRLVVPAEDDIDGAGLLPLLRAGLNQEAPVIGIAGLGGTLACADGAPIGMPTGGPRAGKAAAAGKSLSAVLVNRGDKETLEVEAGDTALRLKALL